MELAQTFPRWRRNTEFNWNQSLTATSVGLTERRRDSMGRSIPKADAKCWMIGDEIESIRWHSSNGGGS